MVRRGFIYTLLTVALIGLAGVVLLHFTEYSTLQAVTLDGEPVADWQNRLKLDPKLPLVFQPTEDLASRVLTRPGVARVDVTLDFPTTLEIKTNNFEPICLAVDRHTGVVRGLTRDSRVINPSRHAGAASMPILTQVTLGPVNQQCPDVRVRQLLPKIAALKAAHPEIFNEVGEIDFSREDFLLVGFPNLRLRTNCGCDTIVFESTANAVSQNDSVKSQRLETSSDLTATFEADNKELSEESFIVNCPMVTARITEEAFGAQVVAFYEFFTGFLPPLEKGWLFDSRFDDVVIQVGPPPDSSKEKNGLADQEVEALDVDPEELAPAPVMLTPSVSKSSSKLTSKKVVHKKKSGGRRG